MGTGSVARSVSHEHRGNVESVQSALKKDPVLRPYTRFERGGVYRFRSVNDPFRLFRVT